LDIPNQQRETLLERIYLDLDPYRSLSSKGADWTDYITCCSLVNWKRLEPVQIGFIHVEVRESLVEILGKSC
jgi:hypothetical protein